MKKNIVYHGSSVAGLKTLEPFKCKHDKAYVYATIDYLVVLHFAAKGQGMFDGWVEDDDKGIPTFYEARPNSFRERYYGQKSYCYHLPSDTFSNATSDPCEVVSEVAVEVLSCKEIEDVGVEYEKLIKEGKFKVVPYNTSTKNTKEMCDDYILNLLIKRGYFEGKDFRQKEWVGIYYKNLIIDYVNKLKL